MLMGLMLIGAIDVVARYLLASPIKGCLGMSEVLLVGVVFFAWPYTQSLDGNVKVEMFFIGFRPRIQSVVGAIRSLIAFGVFSVMAWQSVNKALESMESMEIIDVLNIPAYPFQFFVTVGVSVLCLQLIVDFINFLNAGKGGEAWSR
jgi:TRAP-type C4-dicarboxylate transport system permease small subunit